MKEGVAAVDPKKQIPGGEMVVNCEDAWTISSDGEKYTAGICKQRKWDEVGSVSE